MGKEVDNGGVIGKVSEEAVTSMAQVSHVPGLDIVSS